MAETEELDDTPPDPRTTPRHDFPIEKLLKESIHYSKKQDDLLDIHIGNPLRKITLLLEQIKKEKAFSFTLKGSLGAMGVVLVVGSFGIFGGEKLLCNKGIQSHIGTVRILNTQDLEASTVPLFSGFIDYLKGITGTGVTHPRIVLIQNEKTIALPYSASHNISTYSGVMVIATGDYDSCSQTLKVNSSDAIQPHN